MLRISFVGAIGDELDAVVVEAPPDVPGALATMCAKAGALHAGDSVTITEFLLQVLEAIDCKKITISED